MPGHHAEDRGPHRALAGQGPGPVHHGNWQAGLGDESPQGDRSSAADSGMLKGCYYSQTFI